MADTDMNLSSASAGALADLTTPPPVAPEPATTPVPDAQPATGTTPEPTAASAAQSAADDALELKVNGKIERISPSKERDKLVELAQKGLDYTQKTQATAEERRQLEAYAQALAAREQQLAQFLQDPVKVAQYAQQLLAQAGQQAVQQDPNAVATVGEVQQTLQQELSRVRQEANQVVAQALFQADVARYEGEYSSELLKATRTAFDAEPILQSVADTPEELMELLKGDLARKGLQPSSITEATSAFADLAKARAARLHAKVVDHAKMEAVRAAKALKTAPEPPGGSAPATSAPQSFKLGDPRLQALAIQDLESTNRA